MQGFNQYYLNTKDGAIGGYCSLMFLQPELKMGLFMVMSLGGNG